MMTARSAKGTSMNATARLRTGALVLLPALVLAACSSDPGSPDGEPTPDPTSQAPSATAAGSDDGAGPRASIGYPTAVARARLSAVSLSTSVSKPAAAAVPKSRSTMVMPLPQAAVIPATPELFGRNPVMIVSVPPPRSAMLSRGEVACTPVLRHSTA